MHRHPGRHKVQPENGTMRLGGGSIGQSAVDSRQSSVRRQETANSLLPPALQSSVGLRLVSRPSARQSAFSRQSAFVAVGLQSISRLRARQAGLRLVSPAFGLVSPAQFLHCSVSSSSSATRRRCGRTGRPARARASAGGTRCRSLSTRLLFLYSVLMALSPDAGDGLQLVRLREAIVIQIAPEDQS